MTKQTFAERCQISEQCLPDAPYRAMLTKLHAEMLAALADQPAPVQEPVAGCACRWDLEGDRVVTCERHQGWLDVIEEWADRARDAEKKLKALTTAPQAQPAQRKPLTDEQREEIAKGLVRVRDWTVGAIIDATEAAHNIKENT